MFERVAISFPKGLHSFDLWTSLAEQLVLWPLQILVRGAPLDRLSTSGPDFRYTLWNWRRESQIFPLPASSSQRERTRGRWKETRRQADCEASVPLVFDDSQGWFINAAQAGQPWCLPRSSINEWKLICENINEYKLLPKADEALDSLSAILVPIIFQTEIPVRALKDGQRWWRQMISFGGTCFPQLASEGPQCGGWFHQSPSVRNCCSCLQQII